MNVNKTGKVRNLLFLTLVIGLIMNLSSCQTFENISKIDSMEKEIENLKQERDQLEQTYSEAQRFITQASKAGGYDNPNEFINAMFETKKVIEKTRETIEEFESDVTEITDKSKNEIDSSRKNTLNEITTMLRGFERKFEEANADLDEKVSAADSKFSISMSGLQNEFEDYKSERDNRIDVFMKGINSKIDTLKEDQRNWREYEKENLLEKIDNLRQELTTLAIGRDSVLDRMEKRVDTLAKSMETVAKELKE